MSIMTQPTGTTVSRMQSAAGKIVSVPVSEFVPGE